MPHTYIRRLFFGALLALALCACGQKGPLYLPPECSPVRADGSIATILDEDGQPLPPCPVENPESADEPADPAVEDATEQDF